MSQSRAVVPCVVGCETAVGCVEDAVEEACVVAVDLMEMLLGVAEVVLAPVVVDAFTLDTEGAKEAALGEELTYFFSS